MAQILDKSEHSRYNLSRAFASPPSTTDWKYFSTSFSVIVLFCSLVEKLTTLFKNVGNIDKTVTKVFLSLEVMLTLGFRWSYFLKTINVSIIKKSYAIKYQELV
jgi:hypothetical protein